MSVEHYYYLANKRTTQEQKGLVEMALILLILKPFTEHLPSIVLSKLKVKLCYKLFHVYIIQEH